MRGNDINPTSGGGALAVPHKKEHYAAALVIMTDWELWVTGESYLSPQDKNTEDKGWNCPLSLTFKDVYGTTRFMTYIPLINAASIEP